MKVISNFFLLLSVCFLSLSYSHAEKLSFGVPEVLQNAKEMVMKEVEEKDWNSCQYFDESYLNVMELDTVSEEAKLKIAKISETIEQEEGLRESIFDSVKNLLGLQKKEKIIFKEMKKEIASAKDYYENIDSDVLESDLYLSKVTCEIVVEEEIQEFWQKTEDLKIEEAFYRKQFVSSLKDKMSVLQSEVKNAKK